MRPRDQKTAMTKAVNRHLRTRFTISKVYGNLVSGKYDWLYEITLTPGSEMLLSSFKTNAEGQPWHADRLSVSRLSDFIVRNNGYSQFMAELSKLQGKTP